MLNETNTLAISTCRTLFALFIGTHIEMKSAPGKDYEIGATYQPNEVALSMSVKDLNQLNDIMQSRNLPLRVVTDRFIVYPVD